MHEKWQEAQKFELDWHLYQQFNTYNEETKQYTYASLMGLNYYKTNYYGQIGWDFGEDSLIDIGGGESSILLKSKARKRTVLDPLMDRFPKWIRERYDCAGIEIISSKAEDFDSGLYDCVLIYNVLEHTDDPEKIIKNARKISKVIRIFEWLDTPTNIGHIHTLTEANLNKWLGGVGKVGTVDREGCTGKSFFGVFKGENYVKSSSK